MIAPDRARGLLGRIDSCQRVVIAGVFALAVVGLDHPPALAAALGLAVLAALGARLAPGPTLRRLAALDGFMALVLLMLPFTSPGQPLLAIGPLVASREGLMEAVVILVKADAVTLAVLALLGTLETVEIGHALSRLGAPDAFVHLFLFTVRYIDVLAGEYHRLRAAMKARAFAMRCDRHTWQSLGYLFGMLLVRSVERSERIGQAMRCRGFDGRFRPLRAPAPGPGGGRALALLSLAACVGLVTLEHW